jgi:hypothetical protein
VKWYQRLTTVVDLARWLNERDAFRTPDDVIRFFDEPWHYDEEYADYMAEVAESERNERRAA